MEQQWLLVVDEVLVERESGGADVRDEGGEAVDALGDLIDAGGHGVSPVSVLGCCAMMCLPGFGCSRLGLGWCSTDIGNYALELRKPR
jgi:hypothetical protein